MDQKTTKHPLENVFDIQENTTLAPRTNVTDIVLVEPEEYDDKDKEIETQFEEIYQKAIDAFEGQSDIVDQVEGKYAARNAEVAVQFLHAALAAVNGKKDIKQSKDKIKAKGGDGNGPRTVNNNLIIDRNDLLKSLLGKDDSKDITPIEGEKE